MKRESVIVLCEVLIPVGVCILVMVVRMLFSLHSQRKWAESLSKERLLNLKAELAKAKKQFDIRGDDIVHPADTIERLGYTIRERWFVPGGRQADTSKLPDKTVNVLKFLSSEQKNFALAHELTHLIYHTEELKLASQGKSKHSFFRSREPREQDRDHMAASMLIPEQKFWDELTEAGYFQQTPERKKEFIYRAAQKYNVETPTVFRRISELEVMMR